MNGKVSIRQQSFLNNYFNGMNATQAAIAAGYTPSSARARAWALLHEDRGVMAAVEKFRAELVAAPVYDYRHALAELEEGTAAARQYNDISAWARFSELKLRLTGLINPMERNR